MLSTRGPMSINRPGPSAGRGPMPSHQTGPSAGRGPMTSHHTGPWASRGPHSLHSAASRGMGAEHRGHGMQQDLLDKERKEELILAKQVRQGTVVIRGNSQMKDSSPFVHFDQSSRPKRARPRVEMSSPGPNPDSIRKASNPIALRYWNQCLQNQSSEPPPESCQKSPLFDTDNMGSSSKSFQQPSVANHVQTQANTSMDIPPLNDNLMNLCFERKGPDAPPPRPKLPTLEALNSPQLWSPMPESTTSPMRQAASSITNQTPREARRETKRTLVIKAQSSPKSRSASLPPWTRADRQSITLPENVPSPNKPVNSATAHPANSGRRPGWTRQPSPSPTMLSSHAWFNRTTTPEPLLSPASMRRSRTPWAYIHSEREHQQQPEYNKLEPQQNQYQTQQQHLCQQQHHLYQQRNQQHIYQQQHHPYKQSNQHQQQQQYVAA